MQLMEVTQTEHQMIECVRDITAKHGRAVVHAHNDDLDVKGAFHFSNVGDNP